MQIQRALCIVCINSFVIKTLRIIFDVFFHRIRKLAEKAFKEHSFEVRPLPNTCAAIRIGKRVTVISKIFELERIESAD